MSSTAIGRPVWTGLIGLVWNHQNVTLRNENRSPGPIMYCSGTGILDPERTVFRRYGIGGINRKFFFQFFLAFLTFGISLDVHTKFHSSIYYFSMKNIASKLSINKAQY